MTTRFFDGLVAKLKKEGKLDLTNLGLRGARVFAENVRFRPYSLPVCLLIDKGEITLVLQGS